MTPERRATKAAKDCDHGEAPKGFDTCRPCIASAIRAAVEEEREACAEIADGWDFGWKIAADIRGRKG